MNETNFVPAPDRELKELMRQVLDLIIKIQRTSRWKLFDDDTAGWHFADGRGDFYDGADDAPWPRDDDIDAAWAVIEKSGDPRDIELVNLKRIRERERMRREEH